MPTYYLKAPEEESKRKLNRNLFLKNINTVSTIVMTGVVPVTVNLIPITGSALISVTKDDDSMVDDGTANWDKWDYGWVSNRTCDVIIYPINALKVETNGVCSLNLVGALR
jgi:hypothetical protein